MRTEHDEQIENAMIRLAMLAPETKANLEDLESYCKELEDMMKCKDPAKHDLFAGLPRVKASIIISAMVLVKSEDWQKIKSIITLQE